MAQSIIALGLLLATLLVGVFFAYIYSLKRQPYLLFWTAGWVLYGLHYLGPGLAPWFASASFIVALNHTLFGFAGICFFLGTQLYIRQQLWIIPAIGAAVALVVWSAANGLNYFSVSSYIPASLIFVGVGFLFWRESQHHETLADGLLSIAFVAWGLIFLVFPFLRLAPEDAAQALRPISSIPTAFVSMLLVMAVYEEEKRRVERNMLALSNLNLATSSFVGGEIQRMLAQALDRVLGVVRLPAGALFLHHGDPTGPTSVVSAGIPDDFCRTAQEEGLDDYLVGLVSRLGGLLGFRDLRDDNLSALENDEPIRRFRELALQQGLRSVVVISLQAKEQAFGVLLLGTPDNRRFTPAELRLLLALGHQIGMAVENSFLIQQTSRRSEELARAERNRARAQFHAEQRRLLQRIWEELRRLFDVKNFYIASLDPVRDAIQFDLEMIDGVRLPMRSRPAGNHITEYIMRTRQPVLIRENYTTEIKKLGVDPMRTSRLLLRRAAGRLRSRHRRPVHFFRPRAHVR